MNRNSIRKILGVIVQIALTVVQMLLPSTLFEQITCSIEEGTPSPGPAIAVKPIVTQRVAEIPVGPPITEPIVGEAECNPDEVVTGGGYDITMRRGGPS